ncbi:MAG: hypothetical protein LBQ91_01760, partial [Oscillospiraceae bacterium]|nr:hypothetical protein [Oscillospiraceae bacterium]
MIRKTGFHGTSRAAAEAIIGSRRFKASEKSTEWLGRGIYFYLKHGDANTWGGSAGGADKVVISALISYTSKEYIDFDSAKGKKLLDTALFSIMEEANSRGI